MAKVRTILHSDINNFYASAECLYRPEIRGKPVVVAGSVDDRHGIILAKNNLAKAKGIMTGEAIWQAERKCPDMVVVPPNFKLYLKIAGLVRDIYASYTDLIEPFGLDEAWLDVGNSSMEKGDGMCIAQEISNRIKKEIGVTVSIGVSFNKIFAKLGSDIKKPDAITQISKQNYRNVVWPLPAQELLYVGRATRRKLNAYGIMTIGDIANSSEKFLYSILGKWGNTLWCFANGLDESKVSRYDETSIVKSVGNSTTTPRDMICNDDVKMVFFSLCESVAARMREQGLKGSTLQIYIRDCDLSSFERQGGFDRSTNLSSEMIVKAMELFIANYRWQKPLRSIGVRMTNLTFGETHAQLSVFCKEEKRRRIEILEETVDVVRNRFGHKSIGRATLLKEKARFNINPKEDHVIHPVPFSKGGTL